MLYFAPAKTSIKLTFLSLVFSLLTLSCDFFSMNPLEIVKWFPGSEVVSSFDTIQFGFEFSTSVNLVATERAFSLTQSGNKVLGRFEWSNDTRLTFIPYEPLNPLYPYELRLETSAEDTNGNSLVEEFVKVIWVGNDKTRPEVIQVTPLSNSSIDNLRQPIIIEFSEPIEPRFWFSSFSITPSVSGSHHWSLDNRVYTFIPQENLRQQTDYTITLSQSLQDFAGNNLAEEKKYYFYVGSDTVLPELVNVHEGQQNRILTTYQPGAFINQGWETSDSLTFSFSKPIFLQDLRANISLNPAIQFDFSDEFTLYQEQVTLIPRSPLVYNTTYSLRINKGIKDLAGNQTQDDHLFYFRINGEQTAPPELNKLTGVAFSTAPNGGDQEILSPGQSFPHSLFSVDTSQKAFFDFLIKVSDPQHASNNPQSIIYSFLESFDISATGNSAIFDILGAYVNPPSNRITGGFQDDQISLLNPDQNEIILRVYIDFTRRSGPGLITLKVDNTFQDSRGNVMLTEWIVTYNKD